MLFLPLMFKTFSSPTCFFHQETQRRIALMKLVWCRETASKAYIDTVKAMAGHDLEGTNVAELLAAMAGGWRAHLIIEAWACGSGAATSIGLAAAARHTRGRHVCVVPDKQVAAEYAEVMRRSGAGAVAAEVVLGEAEAEGVDFMVVDWQGRDAGRVLRGARAGSRGMVVVCKNAAMASAARVLTGSGKRVVRSTFLPIGSGMEILHVGVGKGPSLDVADGGRSRWIKHVDRDTGEVHVFRR